MQTGPRPHLIAVRRRAFSPSVVFACGLLVITGGSFLTFGLDNVGGIGFLVFGALQAIMGVLEFTRPYFVYDPATDELRMIDIFGIKDRVYGGPVGERIYFNDGDLMRALPNGVQVAVKTWPARKDDLAIVIAALPRYPVA
ncbi:hypothetical protein [Glycomyces albidus]|uniref:Uncharacterized protein n=1 Tax=Glycomyces albidus TaxID=2656774 RepID=A0A6L5G496_9ACTN|nr:hypothetical protein [Glycomyces albidus]MQM24448.1 hypothetical protein [Glycomyces albidus]